KRMFGETNLGRSGLFMLGTASLLLITASFYFYAKMTERIAYDTTATSGRLLVPLIIRSLHDEQLDSRPAMEEFQRRAEKRWSEALSTYKYLILKPNARKLDNQPGPDEIGVLQRFLQNPDHQEESRQLASAESFL